MTYYDPETQQLNCCGHWDITHLSMQKKIFDSIVWPTSGEIIIDGGAIAKMDSAGAWFLSRLELNLKEKKIKLRLQNFSEQHQNLLAFIYKKTQEETELPPSKPTFWITKLGRQAADKFRDFHLYLAFIGELTYEVFRIINSSTKRFRLNALAVTIYKTGYQALPIIALLSFLIGVVIAYQMGIQLRSYGANIFIVDFLGLSILREFGPLLTAIMVAGRTGSSFTAELGIMKVNQEIDALNTIGVTPAELLIIPKILGLFIVLPLLTIWADFFGIFGGMMMSHNMLGVTWHDFMRRFPHVIKLKNLFIGLGKAPVFALIIASVGCFEGMNVENTADSVGRNTTRSVVWAIFFIIVADAIFSIIFSKLKL